MSAIRPMHADDRQFVLSGWSTGVRDSHDLALVPMRGWSKWAHPVLGGYLDRARVLVYQGDERVTVFRDGASVEVDQLLGFIAYDPAPYATKRRRLDGYVYFVYVPLMFRKQGVASALLAAAGFTRTSALGYAVGTRALWEIRGGETGVDRLPNVHPDIMHARYMGYTRGETE